MEDTKVKLEQAYKGKVTASDVDNALTNVQTLLTEYANHIRSCLPAEAEEPKLRHGDYGLSLTGSHPRLYVYDNGIRWANQSYVEGHDCIPGNPILGNIFDDLKAMAEDLTEFEFNETDSAHKLKGQLTDYTVILKDLQDNEGVNIDLKDLSAFIRNLRIMEATLKRKKNG